MANRQIDPSGPYNHGYDDFLAGLPFVGGPYLNAEQSRAYRNGYETAKRHEREQSA